MTVNNETLFIGLHWLTGLFAEVSIPLVGTKSTAVAVRSASSELASSSTFLLWPSCLSAF
jgi:hypothetical protein